MKCDFNLLSYGLFKIPKSVIIFKNPFKHLKKLLKENSFVIFFMFYIIMIWNWKWKKWLLSISSKYSYFKPIFNYTRKGLWKGTLICPNYDTLMCFRPMIGIVGGCVGLVHALGTSKNYLMIQERVLRLLIIYIIVQDHKIYLCMCIGLLKLEVDHLVCSHHQ